MLEFLLRIDTTNVSIELCSFQGWSILIATVKPSS